MAWPKGRRDQWESLVAQCKGMDEFDTNKRAELQTDKELVKVLPCQFCRRPLVVTTFYVLAWAKCGPCKGVSSDVREKGSVGQPQAGRTEPSLAADLTKVLLNPQFANAICPVRSDDPDHVMELKSVHHNDVYGPSEQRWIENKLIWVQTGPGETVMHQCLKCKAVVTYSTTAQVQFRRCNEPGPVNSKNSMGWARALGVRDEASVEEGVMA